MFGAGSTSYRPFSACSDTDSTSVASIVPNPAVAKRLSQADSFRISNTTGNSRKSLNNLAESSKKKLPPIPLPQPEESHFGDDEDVVEAVVVVVDTENHQHPAPKEIQALDNNTTNNPVNYKRAATIKSPVPISRLKLVSPLPHCDKTSCEKDSCGLPRYERPRIPLPVSHTTMNKLDFTTNTNHYHAHPPIYPAKGQRTQRSTNNTNAGVISMPSCSEQHRWTWKLSDTDNSGRIHERVSLITPS